MIIESDISVEHSWMDKVLKWFRRSSEVYQLIRSRFEERSKHWEI